MYNQLLDTKTGEIMIAKISRRKMRKFFIGMGSMPRDFVFRTVPTMNPVF